LRRYERKYLAKEKSSASCERKAWKKEAPRGALAVSYKKGGSYKKKTQKGNCSFLEVAGSRLIFPKDELQKKKTAFTKGMTSEKTLQGFKRKLRCKQSNDTP